MKPTTGLPIRANLVSRHRARIGATVGSLTSFATLSLPVTAREAWIAARGDARHGFPSLPGGAGLVLKDVMMMADGWLVPTDSARHVADHRLSWQRLLPRSLPGKTAEFRTTVGNVVYQAMHDILKAPKDDRFQVIAEHAPGDFVFDPDFLGIHRSDGCIFIQLTRVAGRTVEQKRAFYEQVADELHRQLDVRREDVVISLVPVNVDDWSFGNGEASLLE